MRRIAWLVSVALLLASCASPEPALLEEYAAEVERWESDIQRFETLDRTETYPDDSILFIGSSSVRLWKTMGEDLAPYPVIRRGFGGAKISDVAWYAERLIDPHEFQALVFFIGGNDIWGTPEDKTPDELSAFAEYLIDHARSDHPEAPIFFIEITPSPRRWKIQPDVDAGNAALGAVCARISNVYFIETREQFLGADGIPRPELFAEDQLHLSEAGYEVWAGTIKTYLDRVLS